MFYQIDCKFVSYDIDSILYRMFLKIYCTCVSVNYDQTRAVTIC